MNLNTISCLGRQCQQNSPKSKLKGWKSGVTCGHQKYPPKILKCHPIFSPIYLSSITHLSVFKLKTRKAYPKVREKYKSTMVQHKPKYTYCNENITRGVSRPPCHAGALPIYIKKYLNAKEEWWKFKNFTTMQKYNLQKNPPKRNQNPSSHYNIITNLKFQHNPKYHLSKNTH